MTEEESRNCASMTFREIHALEGARLRVLVAEKVMGIQGVRDAAVFVSPDCGQVEPCCFCQTPDELGACPLKGSDPTHHDEPCCQDEYGFLEVAQAAEALEVVKRMGELGYDAHLHCRGSGQAVPGLWEVSFSRNGLCQGGSFGEFAQAVCQAALVVILE